MEYKEFIKLLQKRRLEIQKAVASTWPRKAGIIALNQTKENFRAGGFLDASRTAWKRTKRQDNPRLTKSGGVSASSSYGPLLSSRKHLASSTTYEVRTGEVILKNDVEYAGIHNEGGMAGRGRKVKIPKRQFLGPSKALDKKIVEMILKDLDEMLK